MAVKILTRRSGLDLFISFKTVNRQPSNGLKISRQPSKRLFFHRQPSKMEIKINRQMVSRYFKSHYFGDLPRVPAPEKSLNWRNQFPCSQKHSFQTLQDLKKPTYISTYLEIHTEVNIYCKFWTKFPLNNRQL